MGLKFVKAATENIKTKINTQTIKNKTYFHQGSIVTIRSDKDSFQVVMVTPMTLSPWYCVYLVDVGTIMSPTGSGIAILTPAVCNSVITMVMSSSLK